MTIQDIKLNISEKIAVYKDLIKQQNWLLIIPIFLFIVIFDQWTKFYFDSTREYNQPEVVIEGLMWFRLHYNKGIAFGIRLFENQTIFVIFSYLAILFIFLYLISLRIHKRIMHVVIGLVMGGAFGNVIDRTFFGQVVDFIEVEFPDIPAFEFMGLSFDGMTTFPIFNIADSAVSVGMVLIIILLTIDGREKKREKLNNSE